MLPTFLRQKAIRNVHFITCRCEMCENHDLDSLALASRCQDRKCAGFVAGAKCNLCGKTEKFSYEQVCHSTKSLIDIIENFHSKHDQMDAVQEFHHLLKLREEFSEILADCNVAILQLDEQIAYCASNLNERSLPRNLEEIAVRGCESFVSRLSIGAPEVTRRLYIACKCISRLSTPLSDGILNFIKKAVESSEISHGAENTISMYLKEFYQNVSVL
uniref:Uncharacterized protein n=2 Tax=Caenorhabditis japonica TaxID=281687 RepID=A0A8R1E1F4_CAEJA